MNQPLETLLESYSCTSLSRTTQAIKEVMQCIILRGIARTSFYQQAAFYGGTALRIVHHLNRFSEDLDFTLLNHQTCWNPSACEDAALSELQSYGIDATWSMKTKTHTSNIQTAMISTSLQQALAATPTPHHSQGIHHKQKLSIKFEVDVHPPGQIMTEVITQLNPTPFAMRVVTLPDLFACKMHALLCRQWKLRIKGRDWYDLIWFVKQGTPLRLAYLEAKLQDGGQWEGPLTRTDLTHLLGQQIESLDVELAKQDITPFAHDSRELEIWSKGFFHQIGQQVKVLSHNS